MLRRIKLVVIYAWACVSTYLGAKRCWCAICGRSVARFLPWRGGWKGAPELMIALKIVGSDLDNFACPKCHCTDRERHLRLYFEHVGLDRVAAGSRILHFAPEARFSEWIHSLGPSLYVQVDLAPSSPAVAHADIQCMDFRDESFDMVIANHVLEHVVDLDSALKEVGRVMRIGGVAILQTPWCSGLSKTIEDPSVVEPLARRALFGQEDHVRLFGADVLERFSRHGLVPDICHHSTVMPEVDAREVGVNPAETLMRFKKQ